MFVLCALGFQEVSVAFRGILGAFQERPSRFQRDFRRMATRFWSLVTPRRPRFSLWRRVPKWAKSILEDGREVINSAMTKAWVAQTWRIKAGGEMLRTARSNNDPRLTKVTMDDVNYCVRVSVGRSVWFGVFVKVMDCHACFTSTITFISMSSNKDLSNMFSYSWDTPAGNPSNNECWT